MGWLFSTAIPYSALFLPAFYFSLGIFLNEFSGWSFYTLIISTISNAFLVGNIYLKNASANAINARLAILDMYINGYWLREMPLDEYRLAREDIFPYERDWRNEVLENEQYEKFPLHMDAWRGKSLQNSDPEYIKIYQLELRPDTPLPDSFQGNLVSFSRPFYDSVVIIPKNSQKSLVSKFNILHEIGHSNVFSVISQMMVLFDHSGTVFILLIALLSMSFSPRFIFLFVGLIYFSVFLKKTGEKAYASFRLEDEIRADAFALMKLSTDEYDEFSTVRSYKRMYPQRDEKLSNTEHKQRKDIFWNNLNSGKVTMVDFLMNHSGNFDMVKSYKIFYFLYAVYCFWMGYASGVSRPTIQTILAIISSIGLFAGFWHAANIFNIKNFVESLNKKVGLQNSNESYL